MGIPKGPRETVFPTHSHPCRKPNSTKLFYGLKTAAEKSKRIVSYRTYLGMYLFYIS